MNKQEVQADLERFSDDGQWYSDHYAELREQYPDHWIAVYNQNVVASSTDAYEMFAQLKRKHIKATRAFIKFVSTKVKPGYFCQRYETWFLSLGRPQAASIY